MLGADNWWKVVGNSWKSCKCGELQQKYPKYVLKSEEIHIVIWTNTFGTLDKYFCGEWMEIVGQEQVAAGSPTVDQIVANTGRLMRWHYRDTSIHFDSINSLQYLIVVKNICHNFQKYWLIIIVANTIQTSPYNLIQLCPMLCK